MYIMRFVSEQGPALNLNAASSHLESLDPDYSLGDDGLLNYAGHDLCFLDIVHANDDGFQEEIEELIEMVKDLATPRKEVVLSVLRNAKQLVVSEINFGDKETEFVLSKLDPLWLWLFERHQGLLQVDGEGYYQGAKLILPVE
ncbi:MAG: hypothetical protein MUC92_07440 [Fimbriimonadaceae bacterium]|jgi:hypothetical protein|nr:hypothetical protein [Fimbriimonadaceae bacterium]